MKIKIIPVIILFSVILMGCGAPKVLVSNKTNAESAGSSGDFAAAVKSWEQYFNETPIEEVAGADFATAAKAAYKSGNPVQAVNWFDQARYKNYSDFEMYFTLAQIFRKQENLSKELTSLEYIKEHYPEQSGQIHNRLFELYREINLTDKALDVWERMDAAEKSSLSALTGYFEIQQSLKDSVVCDSLAQVILDKNPLQLESLEWLAAKYYWMGENRYQREMNKYNANKTNRQYRILLKELDKSTADFKKSLTYLEKLWKINPGEKYAGYFTNIYARFGDEKKVKYYEKYLK